MYIFYSTYFLHVYSESAKSICEGSFKKNLIFRKQILISYLLTRKNTIVYSTYLIVHILFTIEYIILFFVNKLLIIYIMKKCKKYLYRKTFKKILFL